MKTRDTLTINHLGHLEIGGCDTMNLVKQYGTPLYVMDEVFINKICKEYTETINEFYGNGLVCYASKAFSCLSIYNIINYTGLGTDVVSGGELYTALKAGMPAEKIYFHGNNKLNDELVAATEAKVHAIVIDSFYEIRQLQNILENSDYKQKVLIRVNPGIEAHTHQYIQTTRVDSKFGFSISDGSAIKAIKEILTKDNLEFLGIHCHIGSQIFELTPFEMAVDKMTDFIVKINSELNIPVKELNLGGGFGITYTAEDKPLEPCEYVKAIINKLNKCIHEKKIMKPKLIIEPGRSIVGEAGITLYTVGAIKDIINVKKYLSVDGGMFENPRYALYQAKYEPILAERANEKPTETVTIAGKCCESGDMLIIDACLPKADSGDILAILSTGAYNYSMASNYNRNAIPPVILVNGGKSNYIIIPQSFQDIASRDMLPYWQEEK